MQSRLRHQYRKQRQQCQRAGKLADVHLPGHMWTAPILTRMIGTNDRGASLRCVQQIDECNRGFATAIRLQVAETGLLHHLQSDAVSVWLERLNGQVSV